MDLLDIEVKIYWHIVQNLVSKYRKIVIKGAKTPVSAMLGPEEQPI